MLVKLEVFKTVHNTWPAKNGMAAGESYDLLCIDVSNPPEHRMRVRAERAPQSGSGQGSW
jgi:hypothetical protein